MAIFKGGPGKKAPYKTKLSRIPVAANEAIDAVSRVYKTLIVRGDEKEAAQLLEKIIEVSMQFYDPTNNLVNRDEGGSVVDDQKLLQQVSEWKQNVEFKKKGWKPNSASQLCKAIQAVELSDIS